MRAISAGARVAVRFVAGVFLWMWLVQLTVAALYSYRVPLRGPFVGFVWIPGDLLIVTWMMVAVASLRWIVFVRGTVAATAVITLVVFLTGWTVTGLWDTSSGFGFSHPDERVRSAVLVTVAAAAVVSLVASLLAMLVKAVLPRRRVVMLDQAMPELAREDAAL